MTDDTPTAEMEPGEIWAAGATILLALLMAALILRVVWIAFNGHQAAREALFAGGSLIVAIVAVVFGPWVIGYAALTIPSNVRGWLDR